MIPWVVLERLYLYYSYVESLPPEINWVSSQMLGEALGISPDLVRRDMTYCDIKGKPRQGYPVQELKNYLRKLLKFILPNFLNTSYCILKDLLQQFLKKLKRNGINY